ncbi:hypothetical protein NBRC110019_15000 [Neptunitalea chrysea]|uniref:YD repeat-containing protein n=1 Tax=Neptunitalea chrysea TaxID=1647581 RepID=A0A9W6ETS2_9FLAO|nr:hypothetical protein [Neptunitalea chrysea]GLB52460.1 hypothetical protein NBRC110019_15000 [Neptunitalea chrysea]
MKRVILVIVALTTLLSCSSDDNTSTNTPTLPTAVNIGTLIFLKNDYNYIGFSNFSDTNRMQFEYNSNNQITAMLGGLEVYGNFDSFENYRFNESVVNNITYNGNIVTVKNPFKFTMYFTSEENYIDYEISNGQLLSRTFYGGSYQTPVTYTYEYSGNTINEYEGTMLKRTFYLENDNLTKIDLFIYDSSTNEISSKRQFTFENYNDTENLLKDKYFIDGAFLKAFSENNFSKFGYQDYTYENGTFVMDGSHFYYEFSYDPVWNNTYSLFDIN